MSMNSETTLKYISSKAMDSLSGGRCKNFENIWQLYKTNGKMYSTFKMDESYKIMMNNLPSFLLKVQTSHLPFYVLGTINDLRLIAVIEQSLEILEKSDDKKDRKHIHNILMQQLAHFGFSSSKDSYVTRQESRFEENYINTVENLLIEYTQPVASSDNIEVIEGEEDTDTLRAKSYTIFTGWESPRLSVREDEVAEYVNNKNSYDIWIREPISEICNMGTRFDKRSDMPDERLIRIIKTILYNAHNLYVSLSEVYKSLRPYEKAISETLVKENKKILNNAISECRKYFPNCFNVDWKYDSPFARIVLTKYSFDYCLIEPYSLYVENDTR